MGLGGTGTGAFGSSGAAGTGATGGAIGATGAIDGITEGGTGGVDISLGGVTTCWRCCSTFNSSLVGIDKTGGTTEPAGRLVGWPVGVNDVGRS